MDSFFIWVCSLLSVHQDLRVLDIATGRGQMVKFIQQRGASAYGIDFSFTACRIAKEDSHGDITNGDALLLPYSDHTFDIITNFGSLEHFENMAIGIQEMARVVKQNGIVCLTVPNTFGLRWNVQVAWKTGDVDDDGQPLQRYGTRNQWQLLLEGNGLKVKKILGYEHERAFPRTKKDLLNYLTHPRRLLSMLFVAPIIPVNAAGQFLFICEPGS
jgi:SAM-dependent methyltransferase